MDPSEPGRQDPAAHDAAPGAASGSKKTPYRIRRAMPAADAYSGSGGGNNSPADAGARSSQPAQGTPPAMPPGVPPLPPGPPTPPGPPVPPELAAAPFPDTPPRRRRGLIITAAAAALVIVLAAAAGIAYGLTSSGRGDTVTAEDPGPKQNPVPATHSPQNSPQDSPSAQDDEQSNEKDDEQDHNAGAQPVDPKRKATATAQLKQLANTGTDTATSNLDGKWVPQISAKRKGLEADGRTWTQKDILKEFQESQRRYGNVILVRSEKFSTFQKPGYLVTLVNAPSSKASGALRWCTNHGLDRDHCLAKLVSTTHGHRGGTKLND